jgi:uncharacterized protein YegJ (DUF2314 family)
MKTKEPITNIAAIHTDCAAKRQTSFQEKNKDLIIKKGDFVKKAFQGPNGVVEHIWVEITDQRHQRAFKGTIANDPMFVPGAFGDEVKLLRGDIEDYLPKEG